MTPGHMTCPHRQGGMALIIVLWVVVLLSVIAAGHSRNAHTSTQLAARQIELAQLRAGAQAGVQRAIIELLAQGSPQQWPVNGAAQSVDILGNNVSIAIRDATGLIDLNNANPRLLSALVQMSGADAESQQALVSAILDWRDEDDLTRLNGAEEYAYQSERLGWTIRNGPFSTVDELRYVIGMTDEYFGQLAPFVTVYSGRSGANLEYAPALLIRALTGEEVDTADNVTLGDPAPLPGQRLGGARAGTFHVYVEATSATATPVVTLEAVVQIAPAADKPFAILHWREPMRSRVRGTG